MASYNLEVDKRETGEYTERLVLDEHYMYGSDRLGSRLSSSQQNLAYGSFERGAIRRDGSFERRKYKLRSDAVPLTALSEEGSPVLFLSVDKVGKRKNAYLGYKRYELKNHLGNVMATITDRKQSVHIQAVPLVVGDFTRVLSHYQPEVVSISDYYPFGSGLPNRQFSSNEYRYGFNGKEKDDEVKGNGNSYTTEFRQLDTRLLRWWGVDPKASAMSWQSPYMSMKGNPILLNDPKGDCPPGVNCDDPIREPVISSDNGDKNNNRYEHGSTRGHGGVDILAEKGEKVRSVLGGEVVSVINNHNSDEYSGNRRRNKDGSKVSKSPTTGLGNTVIVATTLDEEYTYQTDGGEEFTVKGGETVFIKYSYLDIGHEIFEGMQINAGTEIGRSGATGNAGLYNGIWGISIENRHVHVEARIGGSFGTKIDPEGFFKTKFNTAGDAIVPPIPSFDSSLEGYDFKD